MHLATRTARIGIWIVTCMLLLGCGPTLANHLTLRLDASDKQSLPKNFRMFTSLRMSGSAQYSEQGLQAVKEKIAAGNIILVDLRQESHGFVNGAAVSWHGKHNWANLDKSLPEITADEQNKLHHLLQSKEATIYKKAPKYAADGHLSGEKNQPVAVERVSTENQLAQALGLGYFRLTVPDHRRPSDADVDRFISFIKTLPADAWLHFHCKAGQGRTTTFMVMYDIMKNAPHASLEEILARHIAAGGVDLYATDNNWRSDYTKERILFIREFYEYCRTNADGYHSSWSSWLSSSK